MYISDRLFSETYEEVLYSVSMNEEEYRLFSLFQKIFVRQVANPAIELKQVSDAIKKFTVSPEEREYIKKALSLYRK